jgi:hypothetical protein
MEQRTSVHELGLSKEEEEGGFKEIMSRYGEIYGVPTLDYDQT